MHVKGCRLNSHGRLKPNSEDTEVGRSDTVIHEKWAAETGTNSQEATEYATFAREPAREPAHASTISGIRWFCEISELQAADGIKASDRVWSQRLSNPKATVNSRLPGSRPMPMLIWRHHFFLGPTALGSDQVNYQNQGSKNGRE